MTHIQYFLNGLCLRRNWLRLLDTRQDSHCDIIFCVFAYLLERTRKWMTVSCKCVSMARFSVSIWCAVYTQKLTLACIWDTMIRYRGVGKVRIISTPNRNRNSCHWNTLSWDHAGVLSVQCLSVRALFIQMCARTLTIYHSAWLPH